MTDACNIPGLNVPRSRFPVPEREPSGNTGSEARLVLAGGCFWCVEAVFLAVDGVTQVVSGYAGGAAETANYEAVCTGTTGHAEAVEVRYEPSKVSFGELLRVFFPWPMTRRSSIGRVMMWEPSTARRCSTKRRSRKTWWRPISRS